jgi:hypothetical protein
MRNTFYCLKVHYNTCQQIFFFNSINTTVHSRNVLNWDAIKH